MLMSCDIPQMSLSSKNINYHLLLLIKIIITNKKIILYNDIYDIYIYNIVRISIIISIIKI